MIYGSETANDGGILDRNEMSLLRWICGLSMLTRICGLSLRDSKKNSEIRELLGGLEPVSLLIGRSRLQWFGHVEHEDDADWVKQCMLMEIEGTQLRKYPLKTWWDSVRISVQNSTIISCLATVILQARVSRFKSVRFNSL